MSGSPGTREVAYRLFAAEFDDASLTYSESDEERAPNYVVTPTGARVNRLFVAGVLTEVEGVNEDTLRARIVDPSGAFVTYAGQYQPDEQAFLDAADAPAFVALTGKARTFEPEDSDRVYTSVRPESVNAVDADTRDRWIVTAAKTTLDRLAVFRKALESDLRGDELRAALEAGGAAPALAAGVPRALDHYDTSPAYAESIRQLAVDALELVAGERDEVRSPGIDPAEGGAVEIGPLPETDVTVSSAAATAAEPETATAGPQTETSTAADAEADESTTADAEPAASNTDDVEADHDRPDEPVAAAAAQDDPKAADGAATEANTPGETETDDEPDSSTLEPGANPDDAEDGLDENVTEDATGGGDADDGLGDFDASDELGDFDDEETMAEDADADSAEAAPGVSGEMYEMDEDERREIEAEFETDFSTGTEIDEPGEADIDVPDPEELAEEAAKGETVTDGEPEAEPESEPESESEAGSEGEAEPDEEPELEVDATDVDLESAAVDVMEDLDDGDGADRDAVVETTVERYGADPDEVEDAIQDALMSGKCYEPGEDTLKAI